MRSTAETYYYAGQGDPLELLESLRNDGFVVEYGDERVDLIPRSSGEIADAYFVGAGGHVFFDFTHLSTDDDVATALAGDGLVTLGVPNDAALIITSFTPIQGVGDRVSRDGDFYIYEQPE